MFTTRLKATLFFTSLILSSLCFGGEDWQPQPIGPFGTLNNRDSSYAIPASQSQDLLNVNLTPGGKSVKKRSGYGTAFTLSNSTSAVHGTYLFFDSNGNDVVLAFNDTNINSSISGGSMSVIYSTGTNGATYQCADTLGFAYCADSGRTALYKTAGVSVGKISGIISTGTMVAACPTRLAYAGFSDAPSRIDFSSDGDFTTWGTGSVGSSGVQVTVSAPGSRITHIVYAFGRLMWFKNTSFGYILIGNQPLQTDWVNKTVAYDVGTNDNTSIYREGILYFRGQDGYIYAFDGTTYQRLSREIAATINLTQTRASNSWSQTTQGDFGAGSTSPGGWIDTATVSGQIYLATTTPVSSFVDTVSTDYGAGFSISNVDTTTVSGSVLLRLGSETTFDNYKGGDLPGSNTCFTGSPTSYYRFVTTTTYVLTSIVARLKYDVSAPTGNMTLYLSTDTGGDRPGSTIATYSFSHSGIGSSYSDITIQTTNTSLSRGTSYWIAIQDSSDCDNPSQKRILWSSTSPFIGGALSQSGGLNPDTTDNFFTKGKQYPTSGNIVSRTFDVGFTTNTWLWNWGTLTASTFTPTDTNLSYETQTSSSASGTFTSLSSVVNGSSMTSTIQEFIRYKASFTTSNFSTSPVLNDVTLAMSDRRRPAATFQSAVKNASSLTSWDSFTATVLNNDGTQSFFIRASTNNITVTSSTPSWTALSNGAIPSITTGTYFQIRDDFAVTYATQNPTLYDFTQNWFEGSAADKMYATYFDDKLWFSVTNGTGATTNNKELIYDLMNQGWLLYDLPVNGFYIRQNKLYFGSALDGHVYKYGDVNNDNGAAINSYWKSKDFFGGSPFTTQEVANISTIAGQVANSSMTVTYTFNGTNSTSYTVPLTNGSDNFVNKNKNLPGGTTASEFNIKVGNNAADQPWEVFGIQVGIRPKSWIPN